MCIYCFQNIKNKINSEAFRQCGTEEGYDEIKFPSKFDNSTVHLTH